jgi:hypothetical protein
MPEPERAKHAITRNLRGGENTDIYVLGKVDEVPIYCY